MKITKTHYKIMKANIQNKIGFDAAKSAFEYSKENNKSETFFLWNFFWLCGVNRQLSINSTTYRANPKYNYLDIHIETALRKAINEIYNLKY